MNLEDDILIEHFLRNKLSKEDKSQFLKRIENDKYFKEAFLIEKQLFESLNNEEWSFAENINVEEIEEYEELFNSEETLKLKNKIERVSFNYKKNIKRKRIITFVTSIAAVILLFVILNNSFNSSIDFEKIYSENIELKKMPSFISRGEESSITNLIVAEKLFKEKKYKESVSKFDEVLLKNKENGSIYVYKAIAHIELGQYHKAEGVLNKLINSDLIDAQKGYWYKGLLFIKSNKLEKAKELLNMIVEKSYFKNKKAKKILTEL